VAIESVAAAKINRKFFFFSRYIKKNKKANESRKSAMLCSEPNLAVQNKNPQDKQISPKVAPCVENKQLF